MRLKKKATKEESKAFLNVQKYIASERDMFSFMLTYMGMMSIMLDFLVETYGSAQKMEKLPQRLQYAMVQAIMHYKILGQMVRDEFDEKDLLLKHMPTDDPLWKDSAKVSEKMVLVVKELYRRLKEEGLIKEYP